MKRQILFLLLLVMACQSWSVPKPMESITNYNVMMVHGAYGPKNSDGKLQGFDPGNYPQAIDATEHLGAASMGSYTSNNRVTRWISHNILEEPTWEKDSSYGLDFEPVFFRIWPNFGQPGLRPSRLLQQMT